MSLINFAQELAGYGLPLVAEALENHPPIPPGNPYIALWLDLAQPLPTPEDSDPWQGDTVTGLLMRLRGDGLISGWHGVQAAEGAGVHILLSPDQAAEWYRHLAWGSLQNGAPPRKDLQQWI